jgi:hypothetical protein
MGEAPAPDVVPETTAGWSCGNMAIHGVEELCKTAARTDETADPRGLLSHAGRAQPEKSI